jgi:NlpC/P60 family putative phage cell wall peptidase
VPTRDEIVRAARRYIGTPYHHQAALAGAGCDCLGLIRGVWRDLYGAEPEAPPPYTPDWGETGAVEHMLEAAGRHLRPISTAEADAGDVVIFRLRPGLIAKHAAILTSPASMIHAQSEDRVREVTMNGWWRRHAVGAFAFP